MHLIPKLPTNERVKHFKNCLLHHLYHLNGCLRHKIWCQRCFQCIYNVCILSKHCRFVIDLSKFWLGLFLIVRRRTYLYVTDPQYTIHVWRTVKQFQNHWPVQKHFSHKPRIFPAGKLRWHTTAGVLAYDYSIMQYIDIGTDDTLTVKPEVMTYTLCACVSNWKSDRSYNDKIYNNTPV
jgi:hypothetical protein